MIQFLSARLFIGYCSVNFEIDSMFSKLFARTPSVNLSSPLRIWRDHTPDSELANWDNFSDVRSSQATGERLRMYSLGMVSGRLPIVTGAMTVRERRGVVWIKGNCICNFAVMFTYQNIVLVRINARPGSCLQALTCKYYIFWPEYPKSPYLHNRHYRTVYIQSLLCKSLDVLRGIK